MKRILHYLIAATRGGIMRARIIEVINKKPMNLNQLSKSLKIDYKTAQHHIKVLVSNHILTTVNKGNYGAVYFISPEMEASMDVFGEIWVKSGKK